MLFDLTCTVVSQIQVMQSTLMPMVLRNLSDKTWVLWHSLLSRNQIPFNHLQTTSMLLIFEHLCCVLKWHWDITFALIINQWIDHVNLCLFIKQSICCPPVSLEMNVKLKYMLNFKQKWCYFLITICDILCMFAKLSVLNPCATSNEVNNNAI